MKGSIITKKNKKGEKRYYIIVDLPRLPGEKRKQKWFSSWESKREAEKELPAILMRMQQTGYSHIDKISVERVVDDYLQRAENGLAKSTYKRYLSCCNRFKKEFGPMQMQKLKPYLIEEYYRKLQKEGLKANTLKKHRMVMQQIFSFAKELHILTESPAPKLTISDSTTSTEHETWNAKELNAFLMELKGEPMYIPVLLAGMTGMRAGEICGLKWKDIDFETQTLHVQRAKTYDNTLTRTKNRSSRRPIKLTPSVVESLKRYQLEQKKMRLAFGKAYVKSDYVATLRDGTPISTNYITKTFPRKVKQLNYSKIRFHDLRHSFATIALSNGIHPKIVQEILGHSDIKVTLQTYSHVIPVMHGDSVDKLEKMFAIGD